MAIYERHIGAGTSVAKVVVAPDGTVTLYTALRDTGSGFYTVLRQIIGQELGVPYNTVRMEAWTTDDTVFDTGVGGSRVTHVGGQATYGAVHAVCQKLRELAAARYGWNAEEIIFKEEQVLVPGQSSVRLADLVAQSGGPVEAEFTYTAERDEHITAFCAQIAEVEVEEDTGEVTLKTFTTAHDVGTILNPISHQGQIEGAVMQGIGYALMEELQYDEGRVSTLSFGSTRFRPRVISLSCARCWSPVKVVVQPRMGANPLANNPLGRWHRPSSMRCWTPPAPALRSCRSRRRRSTARYTRSRERAG